MSMMTVRTLSVSLMATFLLSGCGGGGDASPDTPPPGSVATYRIGGTVTGLTGRVVLQNNRSDELSVISNGSFTFTTRVTAGTAYAVIVTTQPAGQTCSVLRGSGTAQADVSDVAVNCQNTAASPLAPPAPTLRLSASAIKQFDFSWQDVSGETSYRLLENPDGVSAYTLAATLPANATAHTLVAGLHLRIGALYILEACNAAACRGSEPVGHGTHLEEATGYFKSSITPQGSTFFGKAVLVSRDGNTLVAGAPREGAAVSGNNRGAAHVYVRDASSNRWTVQATLKASRNSGEIGGALALSADGNTLVIGADGNRAESGGSNSGPEVFVFNRSGTAWSQTAILASPKSFDGFGNSLALSADGQTLVVAAARDPSGNTGINPPDTLTADESGAVYVYLKTGAGWTQQAFIKASNTGPGDYFGFGVGLSADGNVLAVSAPFEDSAAQGVGGNQSDEGAQNAGAVYAFARTGAVWRQTAYLKAANAEAMDQFGAALALSGDGSQLAVGASREDGGGVAVGNDPADNSQPDSGAAYVFVPTNASWNQQAYIKAEKPLVQAVFGFALSLSEDGSLLAVGAPGESTELTGVYLRNETLFTDYSDLLNGAVHVFGRTATTWSQKSYVKNSARKFGRNAENEDRFGASVSLSASGGTLAVGSPYETGSSTGIQGDQSSQTDSGAGALYLY